MQRKIRNRGFVNFPVHSKEYKNSGEGGMFVRLLVQDPTSLKFTATYQKDKWMQCCGGNNHFYYDEVLINTDVERHPKDQNFKSCEQYHKYYERIHRWEEKFFPRLNEKDKSNDYSMDKYRSVAYLAVLTIGSTNWSGYSQRKGSWYCTYNDLTCDGKRLYNDLKKLYKGCKIILQTWLDT